MRLRIQSDFWITPEGSNSFPVAQVVSGPHNRQAIANLFVAAPELLREAKWLLEMLEEHHPKARTMVAACGLADAIAKAEGRNHE